MRYIGSKPGQLYIEPFVGSASCITQVLPNWFIEDGPRVGADKNPYLIALLQALQLGWKPEQELTEEEYNSLVELRITLSGTPVTKVLDTDGSVEEL